MKNQPISLPHSPIQFADAGRRHSKLGLAACLLCLWLFSSTFAQSQMTEGEPASGPPPVVVGAATSRGARFVAPHGVVELRLEVFSSTGEKVFDSAFRRGSLLDWDASARQHAPDDSYLCVVTFKDLSGSLWQRYSLATVKAGNVTLRAATREELSSPHAQAWAVSRDAQSLASTGPDRNDLALKIVSEQKAQSMALSVHDGQDAQVTATAGALTFRTGDVFTGKDKEQVRITKDGKVGIGTDKPEAALDVAGTVRVSEGVKFADGTILNSKDGKLTVRDANGETIPGVKAAAATATGPSAVGTGTQNQVAKWTETGGAGTLGDSAITETGGNVGIGTSAPESQLHLAGPSGVSAITFNTPGNQRFRFQTIPAIQNWGALTLNANYNAGWFLDDTATNGWFFKLDTRAGNAASQNNGLWLFRIPPGANPHTDEGPVFGVSNGQAYFADNVGIGTLNPTQKLDVAGNIKLTGMGNGITFPDGTTQTTASTGGVTGTGTMNTVPVWSSATALGNSVITQSSGSIGIGTTTPAAKLDVAGNVRVSGSVSAASANIVGSLTVADNLLFVWPDENQVIVEGVLNVDDLITTSTHYSIGFERVLSIAGTENVFVGVGAGAANTASGSQNTFVGFSAGLVNATGDRNSFFGASAGAAQTNGFDNSFFGNGAGAANTASSNSFFGSKAGTANTTGSFNAFFGEDAGAANLTGASNSFFGNGAGAANTASSNSFFGRNAGTTNTEGFSNAFFGAFAGDSNTTGDFNAFFGAFAGAANIDSNFNSFFGASAGTLSTGGSNSFFGHNAGELNTSGSSNAFFGQNAGSENTMGSSNAFFGHNAGLSNTTEANNTFIGANSNGVAAISNATAIGANAVVTQSDSLVLGNGVKVGAGTSAPKEKLHVLGGNVFIDGVATNNNGVILKSPNGLTCAKLTIDNAGALVTTVVPCP